MNVNNIHDFLVLISEKFPEAHAAIYEEQIMMVIRACLFSPTYSNATDHHQAYSVPPYSGTNRLSGNLIMYLLFFLGKYMMDEYCNIYLSIFF